MTAELSRRALLPLGGAALLAAAAGREAIAAAPPGRIRLWPNGAPGMPTARPVEDRSPDARPLLYRNDRLRGVADPWIEPLPAERPNGAALPIAPGGGYTSNYYANEGYGTARLPNAAGISCFILFYRLPGEGWANRSDVANADAQRAMRLIRAEAKRFRIDPARVGVMGFSAGGHLCADLAARHGARTYAPTDAADRLPAKPAIAAPIYPVVPMDPAIAHMGSRAALKAAGVPVETHLFETGGHGFGPGGHLPGGAVKLWPDLFLAWAKARGFLGG